jgi:predicted membrane-bound spermidine synthase
LIGVTLLFLSLGYWLGGRLADSRPDARLLYFLIAIAGCALAVVIPISRPILRASLDAFEARDAGAFLGSLVATLLLFAPTMLTLGMVAPFAIRLRMTTVADAGKAAGSLYALSTAGSIIGSFLPVLFLLPEFGTRWTFAILAISMIVMSTIGLTAEAGPARASAALVVGSLALAALALGARGHLKPPYQGQLVAEYESENNYIQVLQDGDDTLLALNDGHAIHSIYNPDQLETGGPWDYFSLGPTMTANASPTDALIIGLAGATAARQLHATYPGLHIEGVEIDQTIVDVAHKYFGLTPEIADVKVADGRYALETSNASFDLICLDAYRQPYVPFQLATVEFFQLAADHLKPHGVVVVNAGRTDTDFRLVDALAATMRTVFTSTLLIDVDRYDNTMIYASNDAVSVDAFRRNLQTQPATQFTRDVAAWAVEHGNIRQATDQGTVLTDDRAPVEWIIDQIIFHEAVREDP